MRIARVAIGGALVFGAFAAACVSELFTDGQFTCDPQKGSECPPGLLCAKDGRCRTSEIELDAGAVEAEAEAPLIDATPPPGDCGLSVWTAQPDGRAPSALALADDGRLYAGGTAGPRGWIAEVDTCTGNVSRELVFDVQGKTEPVVQGMIATGEDLVVSGVVGGSAEALYARFKLKDFSRTEVSTQLGLGLVGVNNLAIDKNGDVWIGGAEEIFAPTQTGWLMRVEKGKITCQTRVGLSVSGIIADSARTVVLTNETDKSMNTRETTVLGCTTSVLGETLKLDPLAGGANSLGGTTNRPIVVGLIGPAPDGNETGFVAVRDGTWTVASLPDVNPGKLDTFLHFASDGTAVFIGGLQNATLTGGTPTLYRYALPITTSSVPTWTSNAFGGELAPIASVVSTPAGENAIYLAGTQLPNRQKSVMARCRKADGCGK